uniref:NADH-ubiquinone oxidoreductase chain 6 n=1 Tax=Leptinotarsa decemlineata TaxID=7539 RepID=A0A8F6YFP3_LEPDE|nr:NADH dehydrogenase subunit 6 [Leptinotarsa decemlineata]
MMLFCITWIMAFSFMFMNHPLSLGLILLIQTIMIALITGTMSMTFWFSYILFLIMIGGMLILFVYMTSVASNEKFKFSSMLFISLFLLIMISLLFNFMDSFYFSLYEHLNEMMNFSTNYNFFLSINKFMMFPNNLIIYLMIFYLLITLIMVVKITDIYYGPLRQKF